MAHGLAPAAVADARLRHDRAVLGLVVLEVRADRARSSRSRRAAGGGCAPRGSARRSPPGAWARRARASAHRRPCAPPRAPCRASWRASRPTSAIRSATRCTSGSSASSISGSISRRFMSSRSMASRCMHLHDARREVLADVAQPARHVRRGAARGRRADRSRRARCSARSMRHVAPASACSRCRRRSRRRAPGASGARLSGRLAHRLLLRDSRCAQYRQHGARRLEIEVALTLAGAAHGRHARASGARRSGAVRRGGNCANVRRSSGSTCMKCSSPTPRSQRIEHPEQSSSWISNAPLPDRKPSIHAAAAAAGCPATATARERRSSASNGDRPARRTAAARA